MAICEDPCDKASLLVCSAGCAIVCLEDCTHCWYSCDPITKELDQPELLGKADRVRFCTKDMARTSLRDFLELLLGTRVVTMRADDERLELEFSGSLAELLEYVGLQEDSGQPAE
jgi:hypothetical protein